MTATLTVTDLTGSTTGNVQVTASTAGTGTDPDGYIVAVDGGAGQPIGVNGTVTFSQVTVGDHIVTMSGVAANCTVSSPNPAPVTVTSGGTAQTAFQLACAPSATLNFVVVRAGQDHTCGLVVQGAAYCWGWGQSSITPAYVTTQVSFASLDVGPGLFECALTSAGAAYCWGSNEAGQLGNGSTTASTSPLAVSGALLFDSVQAGGMHTCALARNGAAYCWGFNFFGELGAATAQRCDVVNFGSAPCSTTPIAVAGGIQFVALSVGDYHSCGLASGGKAYCWGANNYGQLGVGTPTGPEDCGSWGGGFNQPCSTVPVPVSGGLTFGSLGAGDLHTCGVTTKGAAYCWGRNDRGQLGNDPGPETCVGDVSASFPYYCSSVPLAVRGGRTFTVVSAGWLHSCGLVTGGAAYCWGANDNGDSSIPVAVAGGHVFASLSAGSNHNCALDLGSVAYCWGRNDTGGLGDGTTTTSGVPVKVAGQP